MLTAEHIQKLFLALSNALATKGEIGEVGIIGGAVMCLVYQTRNATRDVDAIFEPAHIIRKLAAQIGEDQGIGPQWLNDAAKGYLGSGFSKNDVLMLPNLRIWAPDARYMLAMKCLAARWDTHDKEDVIFLLQHLKLEKPKQVFSIIQAYYPRKRIPEKTQFFIEEILAK